MSNKHYRIISIILSITMVLGLLSGCGSSSNSEQTSASKDDESTSKIVAESEIVEPEPDPEPTTVAEIMASLEDVEIDLEEAVEAGYERNTVYTLSAGNYTAGVDIPAGRCNITALSGSGNVSSSNMYNGGLNEIFGVDDSYGLYTSSFNGVKLPKDVVLSVTSTVEIELSYTEIDSDFCGRIYSNDPITLSSGNYVSGTDFPAGTYKITAVSGQGNLSSSNLYDGGVNEVFGASGGSFYLSEIKNIDLPDGEELTVSGGLTVELTEAEYNDITYPEFLFALVQEDVQQYISDPSMNTLIAVTSAGYKETVDNMLSQEGADYEELAFEIAKDLRNYVDGNGSVLTLTDDDTGFKTLWEYSEFVYTLYRLGGAEGLPMEALEENMTEVAPIVKWNRSNNYSQVFFADKADIPY